MLTSAVAFAVRNPTFKNKRRQDQPRSRIYSLVPEPRETLAFQSFGTFNRAWPQSASDPCQYDPYRRSAPLTALALHRSQHCLEISPRSSRSRPIHIAQLGLLGHHRPMKHVSYSTSLRASPLDPRERQGERMNVRAILIYHVKTRSVLLSRKGIRYGL